MYFALNIIEECCNFKGAFIAFTLNLCIIWMLGVLTRGMQNEQEYCTQTWRSIAVQQCILDVVHGICVRTIILWSINNSVRLNLLECMRHVNAINNDQPSTALKGDSDPYAWDCRAQSQSAFTRHSSATHSFPMTRSHLNDSSRRHNRELQYMSNHRRYNATINQQVKTIENRETIDMHAVGLGKGGERAW
ncbi:hypothetical protein V8E55_010725 [Tylopilus felleus]